MKLNENILHRESIYKGSFIELERWRVTLPNGREANRDVVRHPGAAAIVAVDGRNRVCLVDQFRAPLLRVIAELPAGKLDPGEDPAACARRELSEETGFACGHLEHLATLASTPGFTDELLHIYLATELVAGQAHADEDEFLACRFVPLDELLEAISRGELTDMKTVAGLLLAARRLGERK